MKKLFAIALAAALPWLASGAPIKQNFATTNDPSALVNSIFALLAPGSNVVFTVNQQGQLVINSSGGGSGGGGGTPLAITAFVNNVNTAESGSTVNAVVFNWTLAGGPPTSQIMDNNIGSINPGTTQFTYVVPFSTDRTFGLTVGDGTTNVTRTSSVVFVQKRYWGVSANASLSDAQIIALLSELNPSRIQTRSFTPDVNNGSYVYFAWPASSGLGSFFDPFPDTAWNLTTRAFVNASGLSTSYNIYRSANLLFSPTTVQVQ